MLFIKEWLCCSVVVTRKAQHDWCIRQRVVKIELPLRISTSSDEKYVNNEFLFPLQPEVSKLDLLFSMILVISCSGKVRSEVVSLEAHGVLWNVIKCKISKPCLCYRKVVSGFVQPLNLCNCLLHSVCPACYPHEPIELVCCRWVESPSPRHMGGTKLMPTSSHIPQHWLGRAWHW